MDRGAWSATVHGVTKDLDKTEWLTLHTHTHTHTHTKPYTSCSKCETGRMLCWWLNQYCITTLQFSSVTQSCPLFVTLWTAGLQASLSITNSITQTHVHWVGDAIQPSHPLLSPCPPAFNFSQHHGLFKWVSSSHQVAKGLEFQLQHQSFQWIFRTDLL